MDDSIKNSKNKPKILIATGIYPPQIGGPATYAKNLKKAFIELGFEARVKIYGFERKLPTGIRHLLYFFKIIPSVLWSDYIIALDTFSIGFPAIFASGIFGKKGVIRTGGDFLHEQYLERTKQLIILDDFYVQKRKFNLKEKIIFYLTKKTLNMAKAVIFSTNYQKNIFLTPYDLSGQKIFIVENYYGEKLQREKPLKKEFLWPVRDLVFKNGGNLFKAFDFAKKELPEISLNTRVYTHEELMEAIKKCYAVILPSLNDISPNLILETIRFNKPFIITKNNGLRERIEDISIFVDPLDIEDIKNKILFLADDENYGDYRQKIENFNFTHSWRQIADEFLEIYNEIHLSR